MAVSGAWEEGEGEGEAALTGRRRATLQEVLAHQLLLYFFTFGEGVGDRAPERLWRSAGIFFVPALSIRSCLPMKSDNAPRQSLIIQPSVPFLTQ